MVLMATGMCWDKRSVDCLILCHNKQNRKISAKSVTMRAISLYKNLNDYRELLLKKTARNSQNTIKPKMLRK